MRQETLTLFLVNLAGIMESADEKVLPAVYKEVLTDLHTDPIGLGSLTLYRSIVQSSCYPLAIYLARRHNRAHVIALGAFLWAAATFLVAISSTFFQVAVSRGLNGIGLAIVIPAIQSLVADSTDDSNRGTAFGWLQLAGNFGAIIGGFCSVLLASTSVMGIPGWRIAFHLVALMSLIVGILVRLFATDPHFSKNNSGAEQRVIHKCFWSEVKELIQEAKAVMRIPSFQIIVAQGVSGTIPGSALTFAPMWLELVGFSHKKTAFLWTLLLTGYSLGGLFGGKMGDILAKRLPNSGRIILAQISSSSPIPLAAVLLLVLPDDPSTAFLHGLVLFIMGFFKSWDATATNNCLDMPFSGTIYLDTLVELNYILSSLSYRTQYDFGVAGEVDDGMGTLVDELAKYFWLENNFFLCMPECCFYFHIQVHPWRRDPAAERKETIGASRASGKEQRVYKSDMGAGPVRAGTDLGREVSDGQAPDGRDTPNTTELVGSFSYLLDKVVSAEKAWLESLEHELDLVRLIGKEKSKDKEVVDEELVQVIKAYKVGQAVEGPLMVFKGLCFSHAALTSKGGLDPFILDEQPCPGLRKAKFTAGVKLKAPMEDSKSTISNGKAKWSA
ncbi:Multidrug resistance protein 1 [Morella rubra]|uniref:Multidrug resistance protein 1 n=1 Tax=Morella rubra TaxID=262757 RepID=A0A6A1VGR9_9ROSI|nr:Multidrug resistance protein 1 [Morella rubra]KAB1210271.1 Multidrug resistance protein 1 [Morella rubra]